MDPAGTGWTLITIIGPILLIAAIVWAALRNRASRTSEEETERATRDLYREEDKAHRGEDDRIP